MSPGSLSRTASRSSISESSMRARRRFPRLLQVLRCTGGKIFAPMNVTLPSNLTFRMNNYFKLLAAQKLRLERQEKSKPSNHDLVLPSDNTWRMKNYFKLLEEQKLKGRSGPVAVSGVKPSNWLSDVPPEPEPKRPRRTPEMTGEVVGWHAQDIVKAAKLLMPSSTDNGKQVEFCDEEEMRRAFTLVYDVFRYKSILKEALDETGFSSNHPEYLPLTCVIWLLLYELYRRRFLPREHADQLVCSQALEAMGLAPVENHLWRTRVRLAAALARNRIAHRALRLNHLLPPHLQDERLLSVEQAPVTAWVNTFLATKNEVLDELNSLQISVRTADTTSVESDHTTAKFDHVCPKLLALPPQSRLAITKSDVVKTNKLILQDRSFCLGATMLGRILQELSLQGTIVQSHVISPRATAYLATVLLDNINIDKVIAFGAEGRVEEYTCYLTRAGISRCDVRSERWIDVPQDSDMLDDVVAVLSTPPCSWTGVGDPVELVCSRSGDLAMLRALTQTRRGRDPILLQHQRDTLTFSMSLPQVQVVVYESHSMSSEENSGMVEGAVMAMNEWARQKHADEQRLQQEQQDAEDKHNKALLPGGTPAQREQREREAAEAQEARVNTPLQVHVPPCDLFEVLPLPAMCSHGVECSQEEGCYIARIQRKEIIGLDAKYMIKIAEARGLFGNEPSSKKSATARAQKKKEELQRAQSEAEKPKPKRTKIEMDRIAAHTHASQTRCCSADFNAPCQRFTAHARDVRKRVSHVRHVLVRSWWQITIMYVMSLLPYKDVTPRTRAALPPPPPLRLPRVSPRRPLPMHTICLPSDLTSEPGGSKRLCDEIRRNSC